MDPTHHKGIPKSLTWKKHTEVELSMNLGKSYVSLYVGPDADSTSRISHVHGNSEPLCHGRLGIQHKRAFTVHDFEHGELNWEL